MSAMDRRTAETLQFSPLTCFVRRRREISWTPGDSLSAACIDLFQVSGHSQLCNYPHLPLQDSLCEGSFVPDLLFLVFELEILCAGATFLREPFSR